MSMETKSSNVPVAETGTVVIIERTDWKADTPKNVENMKVEKIENIVMTTTGTDICKTREECSLRVKEIQEKDMSEGHPDIRYNFLVAEDGNVYEGRGWKVSTKVSRKDGDQFSYLDGKCLYIAFIGPLDMTPSSEMFTAMSGLSSVGVDNDYIGREVKIVRIDGEKSHVYDVNLDEVLEDDKSTKAYESYTVEARH
ncbi:peptidoglycan-recognition protein LF-like [Macrosteles quadrilineatus]|uniref:peptidoglycan-recognition protein LF-like n=1 Tax=Macrosteles quadrilineatus TaxID=74068 RepID=UPI0023E274BD|nr:peptidoglycan-recognition protein LF-like [Macrosteles quadrilineatus]